MEMSAYQDLVDDDPEGFIEVRRRLEGWFPKLSHVATSSMGASIGGYIADFTVTPQAITRAFLSSQGMEKDSLGARVVESRHTGRWRFACKEMHKYFSVTQSPGRLSEAFLAGMEAQDATHSGKWDRNPFVAAMLEIKLSMTGHALDKINFNSLTLWDRICGGAANIAITDKDHTGTGPAGYRVPTSKEWDPDFDTYDTGDVPITDFAPLVSYGSLETLRSMRMSILGGCSSPDLSPADGILYQYCQNEQTYLSEEIRAREQYAPFRLQRDIWCDPHSSLSVEQAVGNPEYFDEALYDTSVKDRFSIDDLVVSSGQRHEENIADKNWVKRSLRSWVYVTSSADRSVRAGMYRLMDLPVFREQSCDTLPNVQCSADTTIVKVDVQLPVGLTNLIRSIWKTEEFETREVVEHKYVYINDNLPLIDGLGTAASAWRIGREALPLYRCNNALATYLGSDPCEHVPYQTPVRSECFGEDLVLSSAPTIYGSKHWFSRLGVTTANPPPPPPPNPKPPPPTPSPHAPPMPPVRYTQLEVMANIRQAEERACTSVYYLSQTTRCERLAIALTQRWLMDFTSPPSFPPLTLTSPSPPPSAPPSPMTPPGITYVANYGATLSTFRLPAALPAGELLDTHGFYSADLATLRTTLASTESLVRACVPGAPLACVTGSLETQCLNGGRRCVNAATNAEDPWVEVRFKLSDKSYLWGLRLVLPRNTQLAESIIGPKKIEVWGTRDEPLPCAEGNDEIYGLPNDNSWAITVVCHPPTATDAQLYALSGAYRVRMTLTGTFRQVWLDDFRVIERPLLQTGVLTAPSPPPPQPHSPPHEPVGADAPTSPPPPAVCTHYANTWLAAGVSHRLKHEPCGLTKEACCLHKREHEADGAGAYQVDDAGCCSLIYFDTGVSLADVSVVVDTVRDGAWLATSGTGA